MEKLRPVQRIIAIAIGLALTAIAIALLLPWLNEQIETRLSPTDATLSATPTPVSQYAVRWHSTSECRHPLDALGIMALNHRLCPICDHSSAV
jgi:hypothetical protein